MKVTTGYGQHLLKHFDVFVEKDEILYRDEQYFQDLEGKRNNSLNSRREAVEEPGDQEDKQEENMTSDKNEGPLVTCKICGRSFTADRVGTHISICEKTTAKSRPVYDVAGVRIQGTEAEELVKAGKLQLSPAKPFEKKSELTRKMNAAANNTEPKVPVAPDASKGREKERLAQKKNGAAYQVMFDDNDKIKTRKPTTAVPPSKLPTQVVKQTNKNDLRHISAKNWRKAKAQVSPDIHSYGSYSDDDSTDFLASSMASNKSVRSDAFDFLFDENNLNPERILERELHDNKLEMEKKNISTLDEPVAKKETCCTIS